MSVGSRIKYHRQELGWSVHELARATGLRAQYIEQIEDGRRALVHHRTYQMIADAMGIDFGEFFKTEALPEFIGPLPKPLKTLSITIAVIVGGIVFSGGALILLLVYKWLRG